MIAGPEQVSAVNPLKYEEETTPTGIIWWETEYQPSGHHLMRQAGGFCHETNVGWWQRAGDHTPMKALQKDTILRMVGMIKGEVPYYAGDKRRISCSITGPMREMLEVLYGPLLDKAWEVYKDFCCVGPRSEEDWAKLRRFQSGPERKPTKVLTRREQLQALVENSHGACSEELNQAYKELGYFKYKHAIVTTPDIFIKRVGCTPEWEESQRLPW